MPENRSHTVLVVDDDDEIRRLITECLESLGYNIISVERSREAVRIFRREQIDLVILDVFMPERDGIDTLMELRFMEPKAKVIVMSGGGEMPAGQALRWAEKLGAAVTLPKPFSIQELRNVVQSTLTPDRKAA
jgi:CheY-like chemotaxis protein